MKKFLPFLAFVVLGFSLNAQVYNNEWIDYSKTYYKFKVASNGLCRIPQSALSAIGLGGVSAADYQLWRDGVEVPIFTSQSAGPLSNDGYIQFYGTKNDGRFDTKLYKTDDIQMGNAFSLVTDSSSYFLTLNPGQLNKRLISIDNDLTGVLLPELDFVYTNRRAFNASLHGGYSLNLGEHIYSSAYETGEGWGSEAIYGGQPFEDNLAGLYVSPLSPSVSFEATLAGEGLNGRNYVMQLNGMQIANNYISGFSISKVSSSQPAVNFLGNSATVRIMNLGVADDPITISEYKLTYRRQYNFGGSSCFAFDLPASSTSRYLQIQNFGYFSQAPVLVDLANNYSITCDVSSGLVRVKIPPMANPGKMVLSSVEPVHINTISSFTKRNFVNFGLASNQGSYVIISHPLLYTGVNNIEKYKEYRETSEGGNLSSVIIESDQLVDQFAFGIRHHPLSIRNFADYALSHFASAPKYFFLLGKGLTYREFHSNERSSNIDNLALVPTFGDPASDNLLTATRTSSVSRIPIGRLSAITGDEVGKYLEKVKQYELAQNSTVQTVGAKGWMKNVAHLTGAINDPFLSYYIESFMDSYEGAVKDTVFGAKVFRFSKNLGTNNAIGTNKSIDSIFNDGVSFLTYFGHSSANNLEFNLDDPAVYHNAGKYPVILINGCTTGNLFNYETNRAASGGTLSEKFIFADQKGSVGFIATTHYGLLSPLNAFTTELYKKMSGSMYGQSLGNLMKASMESMMNLYPNDFIIRIHAEEVTLHGDPALRVNGHAKADYITNDSLVKINPSFVTLADQNYKVNVKLLNIGRSIRDSISVKVEHEDPSGLVTALTTRRILAPNYEDSFSVQVKIDHIKDIGLNKIIITLDVNNDMDELSESNNVLVKEFTIHSDDIRAVYPYSYSIINNRNQNLFASTGSAGADAKEYVMEMDTTAEFNSPSKITRSVTEIGGVIEFNHNLNLVDSTVYYWRVGLGPLTSDTRWNTSSFRYINSPNVGFNQSHLYQFKNSQFAGINIDQSGKWNYNSVNRKLLIRTGLYPYYDWDQININVDDNQVDLYGCRYNVLQFAVFDPLTMKPWENTVVGGSGKYGSFPPCNGPRKFFEFPYDIQSYRKKAMEFIDLIPAGYYFSVTNISLTSNTTFIDQWKADTATYGIGQSIYHKMKAQGFNQIDSFYHNIPFIFVGKKGDQATFPSFNAVTVNDNEPLVKIILCPGKEINGSVTTPLLGPAKNWKKFKWLDRPVDNSYADNQGFELYGVSPTGDDVLLASIDSTKDTDISFINAKNYPYLKIKSTTNDNIYATPSQIKHLMLTADMIPEGAVAPNVMLQVDNNPVQDSLVLKIAFKNISNIAFDSLLIHLNITDDHGNSQDYAPENSVRSRMGPLAAGDNLVLSFKVPVFGGNNTLSLEVNPNNDQRESIHFNNVYYRSVIGGGAVYTFTGSGNWSSASNWLNNNKPPDVLPRGSEIVINPSGTCVLNVSQVLETGARLTLRQGKNFVIEGNLSYQ